MQISRGAPMEDAQTPLLRWVKSNASTANLLSIVLLLFAAWAAVEIVSNVNGSDIPPTTGVLSNEDDPDGQRINNGAIVGLGAVAGTTGLILQLIITKDSPEESVVAEPVEDEDIDGVVEDSMEESQDEDSEDEVSDEEIVIEEVVAEEEIHEEEGSEEEESLEEEESTPEEQGEEESEDEAPAEENKTPIKKRKF
ncbi:MAG: hypothetical protein CMB10_05035 [Euryarchaeota archaeon]|nr:hypothetical protein [Euryarchaeota archaeon]